MSTSIQCFMFTKSQMYPKTHKYHSQMRHRSQRGLIRRYSNCTDLEWLRHFRVCFSQVLVGKVSGFLYFFFYCYFSTCWPCMSHRPHDYSTLPIMTATCQLQLIPAALCRHAAHIGAFKPHHSLFQTLSWYFTVYQNPDNHNHRGSKHAC